MRRIALVGDYGGHVTAHRAIPVALAMAAERSRADVAWEWKHSRSIGSGTDLANYAGIWCVPGSPYENAKGVLSAIRFARESGRPFLGTCGGFQHAMLEYARSEWGLDAAHAETDPGAADPVIAPLECSLVEVTGGLRFAPGSRLAAIYGGETADEEYHCRYGLNPLYAARLEEGPLKVAARDDAGEVRAVELDGHPFFIATLFQPERAALRGRLPPLAAAFVAAVAQG